MRPLIGMAAAAMLLAQGLGGAALAQSRPAQRAPAPQPSAPPAPTPAPLEAPPPYEKQLLRLSELLGALSWLGDLCAEAGGERPGAQWRQQMSALMEAEATSEQRRERLAGAFNRGFRGYETTYRTCTPNARVVIARFLSEGERIARDISNRYGE